MTLCTLVYDPPPVGVPMPSGHDTAPVRIYSQRPYPYWGERPDDHPVPVAHFEWAGMETVPFDLPPGRYWATLVYFYSKKHSALYSSMEFTVGDQPVHKKFGSTGKLISTTITADSYVPICPVTIYCPEADVLPLDLLPNPIHGLNTILDGQDSDHTQFITRRYRSTIRPRAGDIVSRSVLTYALPAVDTEISFSQLLPDTPGWSRKWLPRTLFLTPDHGAIVRLKGWDEIADLKGTIEGAYPGPHGMHVSYVSLRV